MTNTEATRCKAVSVVFRIDWHSRHTASLLSSALLRDYFFDKQIPPPPCTIDISLVGLTNAKLHTISLHSSPEASDLSAFGDSDTQPFLIPPLPPSLDTELHDFSPGDFLHGESLSDVLHLSLHNDARSDFLRDLALPPPSVFLLHGGYGTGKSSAVAWMTKQANARLIRLQSSTLLRNSVTKDTIAAALNYYIAAAKSAQPAVLLLDDAHFVFPPDDTAASSALVIAADRLRSHPNVSLVLVAAPDLQSIHPTVISACDVVQHVELDACGDWSVSYAASQTGLSEEQVEAGLLAANVTTVSALLQWVQTDHSKEDLVLEREELISERERNHRMTTRWSRMDVELGGMSEPRRVLQRVLLWRQTKRDVFETLNVTPSNGVLLYGSPGTGKTALIKQAAAACEFRVIPIDAAMLARGEVGASEKLLTKTFVDARQSMPCVVFLDEIDALFSTGGASAPHLTRLVAVLAITLDNIAQDVVVVAATNRPWAVSKALLRAGRFEHCIKVALPDSDERREIATVYGNKMQLREESQTSLEELVQSDVADGFSGADIAGACRRAAMKALARESHVERCDFEDAFASMEPSVKAEDAQRIEMWHPPF